MVRAVIIQQIQGNIREDVGYANRLAHAILTGGAATREELELLAVELETIALRTRKLAQAVGPRRPPRTVRPHNITHIGQARA